MAKSDVYENASAIPWLNYMHKFSEYNYDARFMHPLLRKNVKLFKELWGKQDFCWCSWERSWVWIKNYETFDLFILTGNRGTSYEIVPKENFKPDHLWEALKSIRKEIMDK